MASIECPPFFIKGIKSKIQNWSFSLYQRSKSNSYLQITNHAHLKRLNPFSNSDPFFYQIENHAHKMLLMLA
jgi:hypothetical protein